VEAAIKRWIVTSVFAGVTAAVVVLAAAPGRSARPAAPPACEFNDVERVVAIGDIHGAYDRFVEILQTTGLVDADVKWSGGKAHLVQLGDAVDRGPDSRKALDLLQRLAGEAAVAGGRVHQLIGNHEAMRMLGDFRYVTPGEYAAFTTPDSEKVKKDFIKNQPEDNRAKLTQQIPLGMIEMTKAFEPKGLYGAYLRGLNAVVRVNGVVFLHGGISPAVAKMSCTEINETVRRELSGDLQKTREAPLVSLTAREDGPLWYRGLALEPDTFEPTFKQILTDQHARAIVVAHTVAAGGKIRTRFENQLFMIDTGMQPAYVPDGRASAIEIRGNVFTAIYRDGREVLAGGGAQ
jgi:hypothetical protein